MRWIIAAVIAVALVGATVGAYAVASSRGETLPPATAFHPGTCRTLAEPVLAVGRLDRSLHNDSTLSTSQATAVTAEQKRLRAAQPGADPTIAGPLSELIGALGWVRLRSDTGTYDRQLWREANSRRLAVQHACTS